MSDFYEDLEAEILKARAEVERLELLRAETDDGQERIAVPMAELVTEQFDWKWLMGGQIGRGTVGMLVADPHVGKSTLAIQLCLALSAGHNTLGWHIDKPLRVLYAFAEGARALVAERIKACAQSSGILVPANGFVQAPCFKDFNIGSPGFHRLIETTKPDFAVLDALGYFGGGFDENSAVEWKSKMMVPLRSLVNDFGTSFLIVHHQTKESESRKGWQKGRGTSAMFADVDYYWRLEGVDGEGNEGKRILAIDKNKYGPSGQRLALVFNKPGAFFDWRV